MTDSQFRPMLASWVISLQARNLSPKTVTIYRSAGQALADWLTEHTDVRAFEDVTKEDLQLWIIGLIERTSASHANNQYRSVQQLFRWLTEEEEIAHSPMEKMSPPQMEEKLTPVLDPEQIKTLLKDCATAARVSNSHAGAIFVARRDYAMIRLFLATGIRLAEMAGIQLDDLDLNQRAVVVTGKGRRTRRVRFDAETVRALDRYLRVRARERQADSPALWLGERGRGAMTGWGISQMVERHGERIGVHLHAHMFRHTFAHRFQANGGAEGDLMELAGWKSPQMVRRYGASARAERAQTSYDRVDVMGNL